MPPVAVRILHAEAGPNAGPLELTLIAARGELAERHRRGFLATGAADVRVVAGPPDRVSFGARLRGLASDVMGGRTGGLVVLGSGSVPLATARDRRVFVEAAAGPVPAAVANNVYSADIVALAGSDLLRDLLDLPDLPADNALPRWLAEVAGVPVTGALALLIALKGLERAFGRRDGPRWGQRALDLDLLVFGRHAIHAERPPGARSRDRARADVPAGTAAQWLIVPHASARERLFVLAPLADLAPGLRPPGWSETVSTARSRAQLREGSAAARPIAEWDRATGAWEPQDSAAVAPDGSPVASSDQRTT